MYNGFKSQFVFVAAIQGFFTFDGFMVFNVSDAFDQKNKRVVIQRQQDTVALSHREVMLESALGRGASLVAHLASSDGDDESPEQARRALLR